MIDLQNKQGFLGNVDLDVEYNRMGDWWGADVFDGQFRLQIGNMCDDDNGTVGVFYNFDPISNDPRSSWPWRVNLLEKIGEMNYRYYGSYEDPDVALQAVISLMILRMEEEE